MSTLEDLTARRRARMRWNTPLSEEHAALLLRRMELGSGRRVLDLGCGWGELLLRAVAGGGATVRGVGVDTDDTALARARTLARERSLDGRVSFVNGDAAGWREPADRVLCVGASHAFGGTVPALRALADIVGPGGRLLFGDGYWERPPSAEAVEIFGDGLLPLPDLLEQATGLGWRLLHLSTADQREWDDFESTHHTDQEEWLLAHPDDPLAAGVREELDLRWRQYVGVYRGVLGLGYLVLGR